MIIPKNKEEVEELIKIGECFKEVFRDNFPVDDLQRTIYEQQKNKKPKKPEKPNPNSITERALNERCPNRHNREFSVEILKFFGGIYEKNNYNIKEAKDKTKEKFNLDESSLCILLTSYYGLLLEEYIINNIKTEEDYNRMKKRSLEIVGPWPGL